MFLLLNMEKFSIIIHGGAGNGSKSLFRKLEVLVGIPNLEWEYHNSLYKCLEIGKELLKNGVSADKVVESCISYLEDDELFNAGRGSVKDKDGNIYHDACIMDGKTQNWGATCLTNNIKNPIKLASTLMRNYCTMIGGNQNAEIFCHKYDIPTVSSQRYFYSLYRDNISKINKDLGTVGAVVMDINGNIAAGTSTGGRQDKLPGRIGDTPLIGISTLAENGVLGLSCTGSGEDIIKNHTASQILYRYKFTDMSLLKCMKRTINNFTPRDSASCGVIGIDKDGIPYYYSNTERFYVASYSFDNDNMIHLFD